MHHIKGNNNNNNNKGSLTMRIGTNE